MSYQKISDREQYWKNEVSDYSSRHSEQIGTRVNVLAKGNSADSKPEIIVADAGYWDTTSLSDPA